jgi:mercuric ion transport protein
MPERQLLATGIVGMVVAALCCFTPALVVLIGAVGLAAAAGYLDCVLIPAAMLLFVTVTVYTVLKHGKRA